MNIDSHQHFWSPPRGDYFWMVGDAVAPIARDFFPKDYEPLRKAHGIDKTVLVQAAPTVNETEYMLGLADAADFVAKVVGWVNFESEFPQGSPRRRILRGCAGGSRRSGDVPPRCCQRRAMSM